MVTIQEKRVPRMAHRVVFELTRGPSRISPPLARTWHPTTPDGALRDRWRAVGRRRGASPGVGLVTRALERRPIGRYQARRRRSRLVEAIYLLVSASIVAVVAYLFLVVLFLAGPA